MKFYSFIIQINSKKVLLKFNQLFKNIALICNSKLVSPILLPIKRKKITVLKSPHVFKKSREQFEKITNKVCFFLVNSYGNDLKFQRFVKLFAWSFLGVSIKKVAIEKLYIKLV